MSELNGCDGDHMAHTVENIYSLALYRKSFADPWSMELIRNKKCDCVPFCLSYLALEQDPVIEEIL